MVIKVHILSIVSIDQGDSFGRHNGKYFSTLDYDNDDATSSCANMYKGMLL